MLSPNPFININDMENFVGKISALVLGQKTSHYLWIEISKDVVQIGERKFIEGVKAWNEFISTGISIPAGMSLDRLKKALISAGFRAEWKEYLSNPSLHAKEKYSRSWGEVDFSPAICSWALRIRNR